MNAKVSPRFIPQVALVIGLVMAAPLAVSNSNGGVAYGTLNNFDTVNDTGVECHGFEIEIEGLHCRDVTHTYDWNHYGTPRIEEDLSDPARPRVRIRYESRRNADGSWAAYTAIPSGPIAATDGHRFTDPSVNFGGEHFGVGYRGAPAAVLYHWLVDDGMGNLIRGPAVNVATPTFNYVPPGPGAPAQVQAVIQPAPAAPVLEFGPAAWVKVIRTTTHSTNEIELRNLVSEDEDDPEDRNWRNGEPDEVEVEWQLLQTEFNKPNGGNNGLLEGAPQELEDDDEIVTVRYEFYKYVGPLDPETGEADADNVGPDGIHGIDEFAEVVIVGDYIGSQMAAFDHELPIGLIDHLPEAREGEAYPTRTVVIAGVAFTGETIGDLPAGMSFGTETGELSGTPSESGIFQFEVRVRTDGYPEQARKYVLAVAAPGEELPPHSIVTVKAFPSEAGAVEGGGFYTNDTPATVTAVPADGFAFQRWTENGQVVSRSAMYSFTNIVNRALEANFVPMPRLTYLWPLPGRLVLTWPSEFQGLVLEQCSDLSGDWTPAVEEVSIYGENFRALITITGEERYFRLMRP